MQYSKSLLVVLATASTLAHGFSLAEATTSLISKFKRQAANIVPLSKGSSACPAIWSEIAADLRLTYLDSATGQCTQLARAAIRAAFHDCGAWNLSMGETGGCDGSLILAGEAFTRDDNNGLQNISTFLAAEVQKFNNQVTTADMIQFSAATAIVTCPLGPQIQTFVGRKDSSIPAPLNLLPLPDQTAEFLSDLFTAKGFDSEELAALLGAHTASQQFFVDPALAGEPQDATPGVWDVDFYANTFDPPEGVFVFDSDKVLSTYEDVGAEFQGFVGNQGKWNGKFADAMTKMSLNGVPGGSSDLIDCTSALPAQVKSFPGKARAAPVNRRLTSCH